MSVVGGELVRRGSCICSCVVGFGIWSRVWAVAVAVGVAFALVLYMGWISAGLPS
ncbi:predicted protein [Plenodomus lingam JN3]|uniref:Uncharacterized protein n=1 Tax=Leptosphaeria maculans (strain JN3 / isolate v23.1.3 / race Av1-4-5-6-7-8) TaxID=985895 RepID=E5A7I9_LEPMJ|nr:predicted protein [Plenodomus lingam JN3]CBX99584.1 predicted protein [Plenodomus lingam JN3]